MKNWYKQIKTADITGPQEENWLQKIDNVSALPEEDFALLTNYIKQTDDESVLNYVLGISENSGQLDAMFSNPRRHLLFLLAFNNSNISIKSKIIWVIKTNNYDVILADLQKAGSYEEIVSDIDNVKAILVLANEACKNGLNEIVSLKIIPHVIGAAVKNPEILSMLVDFYPNLENKIYITPEAKEAIESKMAEMSGGDDDLGFDDFGLLSDEEELEDLFAKKKYWKKD